jgi:2-C-methyl-D-erythritol 4-phosphate cytidylyltransferase
MHNIDHQSPEPGCIAAIMPAAGSGRRFGNVRNKLFSTLAGRPLWYHSAARLAASDQIGRIVMPIAPPDRETFATEYQSLVDELGIELVEGGSQRTDSVLSGLETIGEDAAIKWIAVHDAARPLVSSEDLSRVFAAAAQTDAAILAMPVPGTVKRDLSDAASCETVDRRDLWIALTPQVFAVGLLRRAYQRHRGRGATDDAQLVERIGHPVTLVRGSADNIKITHPEDLALAAAILARQDSDTNHEST